MWKQNRIIKVEWLFSFETILWVYLMIFNNSNPHCTFFPIQYTVESRFCDGWVRIKTHCIYDRFNGSVTVVNLKANSSSWRNIIFNGFICFQWWRIKSTYCGQWSIKYLVFPKFETHIHSIKEWIIPNDCENNFKMTKTFR